ncbi:hypothetical protein ACH5RR_008625, partial [Cinchona calisaya]
MEGEKLIKHLEPTKFEIMEYKAVDEMRTPQKTGARMKSITRKKTSTKMRKQEPTLVRKQVAAAAANSEVELSENVGTKNMEANNGGENMQKGFDGEIAPPNGGENMLGGFDGEINPLDG